jgi:O-6-methylguanine DNA methyltransferase
MSTQVLISSISVKGKWMTVAFRDGLLLACSIPSDDPEASRRMVLETLVGRGIAVSQFKEKEDKEGTSMAKAILESADGSGSVLQLSFEGMTAFQKRVLQWVRQIPQGKVASYKDVAEAVGSPRAYRAVGSIMANNPFPYHIPCHRVVKSDLSIGGYGSSPETKAQFLLAEGVEISRGKVMGKYRLVPDR